MYNTPSTEDFQEHLKIVLRNWRGRFPDMDWWRKSALLAELCLQGELRNGADAVRMVVRQGVDRLAQSHREWAEVLQLRYMQGGRMSVNQVAHEKAIVEGTVFKWQRNGIGELAAIMASMDEEAFERRERRLTTRLEAPSYTKLFGVEETIDRLSSKLLSDGPPWIIAVEGMGGLGKTALADQIMRRMAGEMQWTDLAWVTARQSYFNLSRIITSDSQAGLTPAALVEVLLLQTTGHAPYTAAVGIEEGLARLRERMSLCPHLVVIDNLESIDDLDAILSTVRQMAGPSKFLVTTRLCPYSAGDIYHVRVPALSAENALKLIRHEAEQRNLAQLVAADDEALYPIFDLVGGNPLALRLVVGQLHVHTLNSVLIDLAEVRSTPVESMYTYLYRQAWERLDEQARSVLLSMPLIAPKGEDLEYICGLGSIDESQVRDALNRLVELNLVDSVGELNRRRYLIHSLTRTFLQTQILGW